jgi:hypothetical protein
MFEDKELYGKVQYFFVHKYLEEYHMLAYICDIHIDIHIDRYHIKTFDGLINMNL